MSNESKAGEALDLNKSRAEFEASEQGQDLSRAWGFGESRDDYANPYVQARWVGWQRALVRRSFPVDAAGIKTWRERLLHGYEECDEREARDAEVAELRAALARAGSAAPAIADPAAAAEPKVQLAASRARRVYVAGPMTGLSEYNFPAFNEAAAMLRAEGWHVENPAEHGVVDGANWADYLHYDIGRLATCSTVYLLHGWSRSKGAALEVYIAESLGMVIDYAPGAEAAPTTQYVSTAPTAPTFDQAWTAADESKQIEQKGIARYWFEMGASLAAPTAAEGPSNLILDRYDAGLLSDFGGGNVEWWWDYLRAELDRAHDHYQSQADSAAPLPTKEGAGEVDATPPHKVCRNKLIESGAQAIPKSCPQCGHNKYCANTALPQLPFPIAAQPKDTTEKN